MLIYERENWTDFRWDTGRLALPLEKASKKQGLLYGRLSGLGFDSQLSTMAENLTWDVIHSSEIEGIRLNADEVRSSISRRLGIEIGGKPLGRPSKEQNTKEYHDLMARNVGEK